MSVLPAPSSHTFSPCVTDAVGKHTVVTSVTDSILTTHTDSQQRFFFFFLLQ